MPLPKKAILKTDLKRIGDDASKTVSAHEVHTMQFINRGACQKVFYKPLSGDYTEDRAKYVVASSILLQLSLGKSAAEERLVFERLPSVTGEPIYKIVGTVSFAIPNFKPMNFNDELLPNEPAKRDKTAPSIERLLRAPEIAAILVATYKYEDDDLHPGNLGHASDPHVAEGEGYFSRIDTDRFLSQGSARSAEGFLWGTPREPETLSLNFFDDFPNNTGRCHMPSNATSGTLKSNKKFPKHDSFSQLAGRQMFHRQMMSAALKELLMNRPRVIQQHLIDRIGRDDAFIEGVMVKINTIYQNFYRATVFYQGCAQNSQGVRVPSFNEFIVNTPSAYRAIVESVRAYNECILAEHGAQEAGAYLIDEKEIEQHYHQIWRDSKVRKMNLLLAQLSQLVTDIRCDLPPDAISVQLKRSDSHLDLQHTMEASQLMAKIDIINASAPLDGRNDNSLHTAFHHLTDFTRNLNLILGSYVALPRDKLNIQANRNFSTQLNALLSSYSGITSGLGNGTTYQDSFETLIRHLYEFASTIDFPRHLVERDASFKPVVEPLSYMIPRSHVEAVVVQSCVRHLFDWIKSYPSAAFNVLIKNIIETDYAPLIRSFAARTRHDTLAPFLDKSTDNPANILAYILSEGGIEDSSLNTCIIKRLIPMMLDATITTIDPNLQPVREQISRDAEHFEWRHYANKAQQFACSDPSVSHALHQKNIDRFNTKVFEWAVALSPQAFKKNITENVLRHYTTYSGWFGKDRKSPIVKMLSEPDKHPNTKILAAILDGEQKSNSLSTTAIRYLWLELQREAGLEKNHSDPEWEALRMLDETHMPTYMPALREHAQKISEQYERALVLGNQSAGLESLRYA